MNETQEYLEIMSGRKRLNIEYKEGDIVSGYTASGLSAKIIESLHCGQYIDGWGFLIDREFEDGDIERMKRHFFQWKEMKETQLLIKEADEAAYEKEREEILAHISWDYIEKYEIDGNRSFRHSITLDGHTYIFCEKKTAGIGRVIVPEYEIVLGISDDALAECIDGRWHWTYIRNAREERLPMSENEEKAYLIVHKYGFI